MSVFDLKGSSSNNWNYSDSSKEGYTTTIEGTVVEISNPQAVDFQTKQPKFWPDGNAKRNLRVTVKGRGGRELAWVFSPRSVAANACLAALDPDNRRDRVSIEELLGKAVRIQTQDGVYNQAHPRPWWVTVLGDGDVASVRGLVDLSSQPQEPQPQPQPQQPPQNLPPQLAQAQQRAAQALGYQPPAQQQQQPPQGYNMYDEDIPF